MKPAHQKNIFFYNPNDDWFNVPMMKDLLRNIVLVLLLETLAFPPAPRAENKSHKTKYLAFVGTYTTKTESKGIYAYEFDADTGLLKPKGVAAETPDPSWLVAHPGGKYLYAANEAGKSSTVSAFAVDAKSGKLTLMNQIPSLGEDPCYLSFDKAAKYLLVANYSSGTIAIFPILPDGRLGEHTALSKDQGILGPNKERQEAAHAHWIQANTRNREIYVADLGLDRILIYPFYQKMGGLGSFTPSELPHGKGIPPKESDQELSATLNPGAGPRHGAFEPHDRFLYVLGELQSTVTVFAVEPHHVFRNVQQISTLPAGFTGRNDAAEIAVHPNGKFLYTSNRGHESIAIFAIDPATGKLTLIAHVLTGGKEPRHFAIDPTGRYLLAENQLSNNVVVFKIDLSTGGLTPNGQVVEVPSPVDIAFLPEK